MEISAMYDAIGPCLVPPEFVREVEHVGEKVRYVDEGLAAAKNCTRGVLTLGHGIIPVLGAPPLVREKDIGIIRDVARSQDVGIIRFQKLVDEDTVAGLQTGAGSQIRDGLYAYAGYEHVEADGASRVQSRLRVVFDGREGGMLQHADAAAGVILFEKRRHLRRKNGLPH